MQGSLMVIGFFGSVVLLKWLYYGVIVPSHYRYADKHGLDYDPRTNSFSKRD